MKKTALIFSIIAIFTMSAFAQKADDSKDALAVVTKMFAEMANHNPAAIAGLYTKNSNLTAIIKRKDGKNTIVAFTGEAFSKNFAEKKNDIREDMYAPEVKVFGDLASIWGRYVFFVDGKIAHCGINAFHLVRTDAGWRIANASTTIDAQGCTEQEKAMKAVTAAPTK